MAASASGSWPRLELREPREKAEIPQDAQIVLADAALGVFDEAHAAGHQIGHAAQRIDDRAAGIGIKRVHGEVAAPGILGEAVRKPHHSVTSIGLHIGAKGRDLVADTLRDQRDGAVVDAGGHRFQARRAGKADDPFGTRIRGDVHIRDVEPEQRVAHAAADDIGLLTRPDQRAQRRLKRLRRQPIRGDPGHVIMRSASPRRIRAVAPQM